MAFFTTSPATGTLVCEHRDLSVCPKCATLPGVREVFGAHFMMSDAEYASYLEALEEMAT